MVDRKIGRLAENCEWLWGTLRQAITSDRAIFTQPKLRPSSSYLRGLSALVIIRLSYEWIWITLGRWNLPSSAVCFPSASQEGISSDRIKSEKHENLFQCLFRLPRFLVCSFHLKKHRAAKAVVPERPLYARSDCSIFIVVGCPFFPQTKLKEQQWRLKRSGEGT